MKSEKSEVRGQKSVASSGRAALEAWRACLPRQRRGRAPIPFRHSRKKGNPVIKAVLFDFDGTLTVPGLIDFMAVKKAINCPDNSTILEFIGNLSPGREQKKALAVLVKYEDKAAEMAAPNENAEEVVCYLKKLKIKLGILTRNSMRSVKTALRSFQRISLKDFNAVITREHALKLKPHPEGVHEACRLFGVFPSELVMVGDYVYDIQAGQKAGAYTVFLESCHTTKRPDPPADWTIKRLDELKGIFRDEF